MYLANITLSEWNQTPKGNTGWLHLPKVQKQVKLIYGNLCWDSSYPSWDKDRGGRRQASGLLAMFHNSVRMVVAMGGSSWWKFIELYVYAVCTFLSMCYISMRKLHKVLIWKTLHDNATPFPQPAFLAVPQLCSLHSYDNFLITVLQHTNVGCSLLEDFALTTLSIPRFVPAVHSLA